MKKNLIICAIATILLVCGCDKIDENQRIVFSGAVGTWYDGTGVSDHTQRALIEKYTGPKCVNCPTADEAIHAAVTAYNGKLIATAIHVPGSTFGSPIGTSPDLRVEDGGTWHDFFVVSSAYPVALVNRQKSGTTYDLFTPTSGIEAKVDPIINSTPSLAIAVESKLTGKSDAITVNLEFLNTINDSLTLTVFIMEDSIIAAQRMPDGTTNTNYVHNHVLRDVVTDIFGINVDADGKSGTKRFVQISYDITSANINPNNLDGDSMLDHCHIVAFVSNKTTREIINVAECPLR